MPSDRSIVLTRGFDAPSAAVWRAMADPKQVVHWWGPRGAAVTIQQMDVRPGGLWAYVLHVWGANVLCRATFTEVVEAQRLAFAQDDVIATWNFAAEAEARTQVTAELAFATAAKRDAMARNQMMMGAARQGLDRLGEWLARRG